MKKKALAVALVVLGGSVLAGRLATRPRVERVELPRPRDVQLARAALEARANCEAARLLGAGSTRVLLGTDELALALRVSPALSENEEEHVRLLLVSRLVRHLGRALEKGEGARRLEEERLTEEDFRFLLGAVESRLARALGDEPRSKPDSYDRGLLRQFRGLGFEEGLRKLFE